MSNFSLNHYNIYHHPDCPAMQQETQWYYNVDLITIIANNEPLLKAEPHICENHNLCIRNNNESWFQMQGDNLW